MSRQPGQGQSASRHVYDVIVLGGQLSGIFTTALLAKRGLRVLHLPHDGVHEPYRHGAHQLPVGQFFLPPVKAMPLFEALVHELGLAPSLTEAMRVVPLQLIEAHRRFELFHDEKHRGPELARALGAAAEPFDELLRQAQAAPAHSEPFFQRHSDFPPQGLWARWALKRELSAHPEWQGDTPLGAEHLLRKWLPFLAGVDHPGPISRARALGFALAGPALIRGGYSGLWQAVAARARELGADIVLKANVERVLFDGSSVGVRIRGEDTPFHGATLVAAMDLEALAELVPDKVRSKAAPAVARVAASRAIFSMHWVLPEWALPRGLGQLALMAAPGLADGAVLTQVSAAANPEHRILTCSAPAPLALRRAGESAVRAFVAELHAVIDQVMPFTRQHVLVESAPWIDAPQLPEGAPLFAVPPDSWLGLTGHPTQSPWRHVLLASRQVFPGLGFEGELKAAQRAATQIVAQRKKS